MDDNLKKSIRTKFFFGQGRDEQQVLTKQVVTSLSVGLTSIQNAFNEIKAYTGNIGKIQKAVVAARVSGKKEAGLERSNIAPIEAPQDQITNLFPKLTKGLEDLKKSLEKFEMDQAGGGGSGGGGLGGGGGMGLLGKLALGAGAVGLGYMMFSGDKAEAATPSAPPPPEPEPEPTPAAPKASEVSQQAERKASERRAENEQSGSRKAQKQATQEQKTEKLTKAVEQTATKSIPVTRAAAPQATNSWTDNLSNFISKSVEAAEARSAASATGGMGGGMGGGDPGGGGGESGSFTAGAGMKGLLDLIASGEGGYNSMNQGGANQGSIRGSTHNASRILGKNLPQMTVGEVKRYQALPQSHPQRLFAAGRYQIIPSTMNAVTRSAGVSDDTLFDEATQDKLGAQLVLNRRPARNYISGSSNDANAAIVSLAQEWASLPNLNNQSYYPPHSRTPHTAEQVKAALDAARTGEPVTVGGGAGGGAGFTPGASTGPIQRSGEAVRGMGFETAQAATRQMGIRGTNGNLDSSQLEAIGVGSLKAAPPAARAFKAMRAAAAQQGINLGATDAYRDYATQVRLKRQKGRLAATPGRSNHGWGLAFDIPGLRQGNAAYRWMKANSERFGIYGPLASPSEIWHWEYRGGGNASAAAAPVSGPGSQTPGPTLRSPAGGTINDAAISSPRGCVCPEPTVVPVPVGGGAPSPTDYLRGQRPAQASRKYNADTSEDYRVYFNAA